MILGTAKTPRLGSLRKRAASLVIHSEKTNMTLTTYTPIAIPSDGKPPPKHETPCNTEDARHAGITRS